MVCLQNRLASFTLLIVASAASAPHARADVFEFGNNGSWQQVDAEEVAAPDIPTVLAEMGAAKNDLPPVRLAVVTGSTDVPVSVQAATGPLAPLTNAAARQYGISPALVDAVMWQESRYNHRAVSSAGAIGLMQLMPGTARSLGVNPYDPWQNVFGGAAYLREQLERFNNQVPLALAAYNAGPEAVARYGGIPPYAETRNYVSTIMQRLKSQGQ